MKHNNLKGSLILGLASLIWGLAFVAQSGAAKLVPSFTFNALRSFIGAIALLVFWIFKYKNKEPFFPQESGQRADYVKAAAVCGVCLAISVNFQQFGIAFYPMGVPSEARAGFLTALYVIVVPVFSVFAGKKIKGAVWLSVLIAVIGVYMLCLSDGIDAVYIADLLVFLCAVSFAVHIMAVDKYVGITGGIKLSIMQFAVAGLISTLLALIFETVNWQNILSAAPQILYLGIMSSGVAYTLQIVGQKYAEPSVASVVMSLESVFAALGGWIISGNSLSYKEIIGCGLVFAAIIIAQSPYFIKRSIKKE